MRGKLFLLLVAVGSAVAILLSLGGVAAEDYYLEGLWRGSATITSHDDDLWDYLTRGQSWASEIARELRRGSFSIELSIVWDSRYPTGTRYNVGGFLLDGQVTILAGGVLDDRIEFESGLNFYGIKFVGTIRDTHHAGGTFRIYPYSWTGPTPNITGTWEVSRSSGTTGAVLPLGSPLRPSAASQASAAAAAGGLTSMLAWMLSRIQAGKPLPSSLVNDQGQVFFQPPWEQGGPMWLDREEFDKVAQRVSEGLVWSDRWGWTTPDQLSENERVRAANWLRTVQGQGNMMDVVRAQRALEAMGRVDQYERNVILRWIDRRDISEEGRKGLRQLVDEMVIETDSGLIGDIGDIRRALYDEMLRQNQPELTYWEQYAIREEQMKSQPLADFAGDGLTIYSAGEFGVKYRREYLKALESKDLSKVRELLGDSSLSPSAVDVLALANNSYNYYHQYSHVMGGGEAAARTATQVGVQYFATKNPVIGLVDSALGYSTSLLTDQEVSISKGLEVLVNMGFDAYTQPFANTGPAALDLGSSQVQTMVTNSRANALDQVLQSGTLSPAERDQLLTMRRMLGGEGQ